ncbi:MAG: 6-phosphofructokinase, partial [uncultured Rubrobacteraceae bacterium]
GRGKEGRDAHRRRRRAWPERRHKGRHDEMRRGIRLRGRRPQARLEEPALPRVRHRDGAGHGRRPLHPAGGRDHPRLLPHQPVQAGGRPREGGEAAGRVRRGRPRRHRRGRHFGRRQEVARRLRDAGHRLPEDHRQRPVGHGHNLRLRHGRLHRDRRHRQAAHHRQEPRAGRGRRGDGASRRLDHLGRRPRERRQRHPHPGGGTGPRRDRLHLREASRQWREVGPRGRLRGRDPLGGVHDPEHRDGRVRPRPARRHRGDARQGDRIPHRHRDPPRRARPPAARRHPDGLRPHPLDPLRPARRRGRQERRVGQDGSPPRQRDRHRGPLGGHRRDEDRPARPLQGRGDLLRV